MTINERVSPERLAHIRASYEASRKGYAFIGHPSYNESIAIIDELQQYRAAAEPVCQKCGGTGMADSGGVQPCGEPILIECDCRAAPQLPLPAVVDADDNFYSWFGREWHENYQHNQYTTAAKQMLGVMAESAWRAGRRAAMLKAAPAVQQVANVPQLAVWYGSMPESNGKTNWTAILHRKGEGILDGFTIDRSEYPGRVLYAADRVRYLIGEMAERPYILNYDADEHSGCTAAPAVQAEQLSGNTEQVSHPVSPKHSPCIDAPDHIWLQTAGEWPASGEFSELTWSCDNQHPDDTLYVRADLVGNSPGYLQGYKDGCEWAARMAEANHPQTGDWLFDDPIELAKAIRKGPDMLPVEPGNSPAIPDGWTGSDKANAALVMLDRIDTLDPVDDDRIEGIKRIIRELASAPQQEAE